MLSMASCTSQGPKGDSDHQAELLMAILMQAFLPQQNYRNSQGTVVFVMQGSQSIASNSRICATTTPRYTPNEKQSHINQARALQKRLGRLYGASYSC